MAASSRDENSLIPIGLFELHYDPSRSTGSFIILDNAAVCLSYGRQREHISIFQLDRINFSNGAREILDQTKLKQQNLFEICLVPISNSKFCLLKTFYDMGGYYDALDIYENNKRIDSFELRLEKRNRDIKFYIDSNHPDDLIMFFSNSDMVIRNLKRKKTSETYHSDAQIFYMGNGELAEISKTRDNVIQWTVNATIYSINFLDYLLRAKSTIQPFVIESYPPTDFIPSPKDPNIWLIRCGHAIRVAIMQAGRSETLLKINDVSTYRWLYDGSLFIKDLEGEKIGRIFQGKIHFSPWNTEGNWIDSIKFISMKKLPGSSKAIVQVFTIKNIQDEIKKNIQSELANHLPFAPPLINIVADYVGYADKKSTSIWTSKNTEEKEFQEILNLFHKFNYQMSQSAAAASEEVKLDSEFILKKDTLGFLIENIQSLQSIEAAIKKLSHPDVTEFKETYIKLIESGELPLVRKFMQQHGISLQSQKGIRPV